MKPIIGDRAALEARVGRELPADLFKFRPWGRRVLVAREEGPDAIGGIWLPDQAKEPLSVGWIVSVGPLVGSPPQGMEVDYGGWFDDPANLPGLKVLFGKYAGQALLVGDRRETDYDSLYTLLTDLDIWGDLDD